MLQYDDALVELTELIAIVCGVFLLQGRNWARWLALAWIASHAAFMYDVISRSINYCKNSPLPYPLRPEIHSA